MGALSLPSLNIVFSVRSSSLCPQCLVECLAQSRCSKFVGRKVNGRILLLSTGPSICDMNVSIPRLGSVPRGRTLAPHPVWQEAVLFGLPILPILLPAQGRRQRNTHTAGACRAITRNLPASARQLRTLPRQESCLDREVSWHLRTWELQAWTSNPGR